VWRFLKKLKQPYSLATSLLGTYPKECKSTYNRDTCISMFIAALFTIAKLWNQPRYPSTHGRIKKIWHIYIHTMEYY
jgi:hypothetical protein